MHAKSYSEVTSVEQSSPARSPRRPLYYVQSPSNHDVEKMSYGSSPMGSPPHHFYHASPIHHSRESSTSRFSASLKPNPRNLAAWRKLHRPLESDADDDDDDATAAADDRDSEWTRKFRLYLFLFVFFVLLFTVFSLILWGASRSFHPQIILQVHPIANLFSLILVFISNFDFFI